MKNLKHEANHCSKKARNMLFKVNWNRTYLLSQDETEWIPLSMSYIELLEWGVIELHYNPIDWIDKLEQAE